MTLINITNPPLYDVGTINLVQGSDIVNGTGTAWQLQIIKYGLLTVSGQAGIFYIDEVVSDTQLRLNKPWPYTSLSNVSYFIFTQFGSITDAKLHNAIAAVLDRVEKSLAVHVFQEHELDENDTPISTVGNDNDLGFIFDEAGAILSNWQKIDGVWQDETNLKGAQGDQGFAGTITINQVITGGAGSSTLIENVGTPENAALNITIPRGDQGVSGTLAVGQTITGLPGSNADVVNTGTSENAVLDFTIPEGEQGIQGPSGTLSIGQVNTGIAGANAAAVNIGTSENAIIDFTIPRGDKGEIGDIGPVGPALIVEAEGLLSQRSTYDAQPKGFSFYATDEEKIYTRSSDTAGQWIGPITVGNLKPVFYGFRVDENYNLLMDTDDGEYSLDDYLAYSVCPGACDFVFDDGALKVTF